MRRIASCIFLLAFTILGINTALHAQVSCTVPTFTVPQGFFGITQLTLTNTLATSAFNVGYVRLWDTTCVWSNIETSNGVFTYTTTSNCDNLISFATSHGAAPDFVFGRMPSWAVTSCAGSYAPNGCAGAPTDLGTGNGILSGMVTSLVTHLASTHPGVHWVFECINEADLTGEWTGANGTSDRINAPTALCTALRSFAHTADPSIIVLGPSGSSLNVSNVKLYSDGNAYATRPGAAASLDGINIHGYLQSCGTYCASPDLLETYYTQVNNLTKTGAPLNGKPVWFTEWDWGGAPGPSGGTSQNSAFTAAQKGQYLARTVMYFFINNVASQMEYAFDSHTDNLPIGFGSLCEGVATGCTPNRAAVTMATMENWLVGSTYLASPCFQDTNGTWSCILQTSPASTSSAMIIFNGTTTHSFAVPAKYTKVINWDGTNTTIVANSITAGPDVVMAIP